MNALHSAVEWGHLETVRILLEAQADPGRATRSQKTALHLAVRAERLEMMRLFLEKDVATSDRNTFACYAAERGNVEMLLALLKSQPGQEDRPKRERLLHWAAEKDYPELVDCLLQSDVTLHGKAAALQYAAWKGHTSVVQMRQRIEVNGIFDRSASCSTSTCLSHRLYECYMRREEFNTADGRYGLQSSCVVDYSYAGAGFYGPPGRGTWTAEFNTNYDEAGAVTSVQVQPCAFSTPANFICRDGGACEAGDPYITPDDTVSSKRINIPTTRRADLGKSCEVLPSTEYVPIDGSPTGVLNELNCDPGSPVGCRLSGGSRQDYKVFGGTYGFRFILGTSDHEARGFHTSKDVDVCYCNEDCNTGANWFKVGSMRVSSTRLVSAATSRSELPAQWSLEFVNQPGIIGLYRPYADGGVLGLQVLRADRLSQEKAMNDDGCALSGYNSQFSQGLSSEVAASTNYLGKLQTQTPPDLQKVVFNSNSFVNTITVTQAGTLAVCYCAVTVDSTCPVPSNWKLVTHLTVKGPQINQRWTFSTNVVFRFSYEGYGLTSGDTIRIISSDGKCTETWLGTTSMGRI
eukprot:g13572.t1